MTVDFESHRRDIENDPNRVRCAHCGGWVEARAKRCRKCGVNFRGEAFQFAHESDDLAVAKARFRRRAQIVAIAIGVLFLIGVGLFFAR